VCTHTCACRCVKSTLENGTTTIFGSFFRNIRLMKMLLERKTQRCRAVQAGREDCPVNSESQKDFILRRGES
jgi:hypothetical protein